MTYVVVGMMTVLSILMTGQMWLVWRVWRGLPQVQELAEQQAHMGRSLRLLTETTETGFASFAGVLSQSLQARHPKRGLPQAKKLNGAAASAPRAATSQQPWRGKNRADAASERRA